MKKISESACLSKANTIGDFEGSGIYPLYKEKMTRKIEVAKIIEEGENCSLPSTSSPAESVGTVRKNIVPSASSNFSISTSTKQPTEDLKQSIERAIMTILQYKHKKETTPNKRSHVFRKFAESLTDAEVIERLRDIENKKQLKLNKLSKKKTMKAKAKTKRKIGISSSSESDVSVHRENDDEEDDFCDLTIENEINVNELDNNNHLPNLTQDRELNCPKGNTDVSRNNDSQEIPDSNKNNDNKQEQPPVVVGKWILAKHYTKKDVVHYIGKVLNISDNCVEVDFLRKKELYFVYPDIQDKAMITLEDIDQVLNDPIIQRGKHYFKKQYKTGIKIY
ncbi:hypothetical protein NQ314_009616 [Rhamnusium bicolor]|uniref:Uncharacterized protein n=1 Tax=Rhamnusium bicolor TaxID=1586634 RepID=A0AAV8XYU3_9CUCU|nr:hypothetical protein NQ314_009616 [Rhamnusium bicolor]